MACQQTIYDIGLAMVTGKIHKNKNLAKIISLSKCKFENDKLDMYNQDIKTTLTKENEYVTDHKQFGAWTAYTISSLITQEYLNLIWSELPIKDQLRLFVIKSIWKKENDSSKTGVSSLDSENKILQNKP